MVDEPDSWPSKARRAGPTGPCAEKPQRRGVTPSWSPPAPAAVNRVSHLLSYSGRQVSHLSIRRPALSTNTAYLHVREVSAGDDFAALTELIHSAYAPHAASGLRYWATHQSVEDTRKRLANGIGLVAEVGGEIVGTITVSPSDPQSKVSLLAEPDTWSFGQFCVVPSHKGKGLGRQIHDFAVKVAIAKGCQKMALHTAQPAFALIGVYRSWGYQLVGTCGWRPHTNYLSVLMAKRVGPEVPHEHAA